MDLATDVWVAAYGQTGRALIGISSDNGITTILTCKDEDDGEDLTV